MARAKIGITLTDDTLKRLEELCEDTGLNKSQQIALLINSFYIEKKKGESSLSK